LAFRADKNTQLVAAFKALMAGAEFDDMGGNYDKEAGVNHGRREVADSCPCRSSIHGHVLVLSGGGETRNFLCMNPTLIACRSAPYSFALRLQMLV